MKRKLLSIVLALCLTLTLLPTMSVAAGSYADTAGHWAESSIERWSAYGIIQGSNGQFDPNGQLTCAQLATILAKLLKLPAAKDAGFTDNTADAWYYDAINRCAAAGILNGNGDGTVTPEAPISRERAIVMLGRALGIEPIREPDLTKYTDAAKVAPYAQGMVAAMIEAGIVGGVTADELAPQDNINRASTVTILDRAISTYADEAGATVKADGKGIVLVVVDDVTVTGDVDKLLVPADNVDVTVSGSKNIDDITVTGDNSKVILNNSTANDVTLDGKNTELETKSGSKVENVSVTEDAKGATVNAGSGTTVKNVENSAADTTVTGSGSVKNVASDTDVTVKTKDTDVKNIGDSKITVTDKNGKDTTVGTTGSGSSTTVNKETTSSGGGYSHTHSYDATTHKCSCGAFDPAVVATIGNTNGYLTLKKAVAAAQNGDTVKLVSDITTNTTIAVTDDKAITIDFGTYTLTGASGVQVLHVGGTANVTLTATTGGINGGSGGNNVAIIAKENATINITSGNYTVGGDANGSGNSTVYVVGNGKVNISGGTFSSEKTYQDKYYVLNLYNSDTGSISVTGGTFVGQNPGDGDDNKGGTFLAPGYTAKKLEGDKYQVVALFDGGTGTAEDPFLIATSEQFKAIDQLNGAYYCFKQTADIAVAAGDEVTKFAGVYDGGNQKLSSARTSGNFAFLFNVGGLSGHATFKNINVAMGELATSLLSCADWGTSYGADFKNLTFTSTSELTKANSSNFGFVVSNAIYTGNGGAATYNFKDITVNVNLQNAGTCTGVLIGSGPCFYVNTTMNFINCTNNGTITGTSSVGFLYGNSAYIGRLDEFGTIDVTKCTTNAVIKSTNDSADVAFAPGASKSTKAAALNASYQQADKYIVGNCLNGKTIRVTQNAGADEFSIAIDDASGYTYKLALNVAATYRTLDGKAWDGDDVAKIPSNWDEAWNVSNGLKYLIALSKDTNITGTLNSFHAYDKRTAENKGIEMKTLNYNEDGYAIVVKDGTNYVVFNTTEDTYIDSSVSILVYAYSGNTLVGTRAI